MQNGRCKNLTDVRSFDKMKIKSKLKYLLCLCALLAVTAAGCGSAGNQNIEAGMAAIGELNYQGALELFEKALVSGEDTELIYRGQGIAYLGLTEYEAAADAFRKALGNAQGPGDLEFDINYYLATAYVKSGQLDEAIGVYTAITGLRPKEKDAWFYRGTLKLEKGDYDQAAADFDKALSIAPEDYSLYIDISQSLTKKGYQDAAKQYLQAALDRDDKGLTDLDRGRLYFYLEDYNSARDCLERAKDAGGAQAALYLGRAYEALGDDNYAASIYSGFLAKDTGQPQIYNQLGLCRLSAGEYQEALEAFQAGLAIEGDNTCLQSLSYNEIVTYEHLGQFKKAAVLMEGYLKNYPDDESAKREYEFLKTR